MTQDGQRLLMVIDDEPAQRRLVAAIAGRRGWRTIVASDAAVAMAMLDTPDGMALDAVLVDHWSPDRDAAALVAELHATRPTLPILLLTANGSIAGAVAAMRAGASDFLVKPLAADRLLAALDAAVGAHHVGELRPLSEKLSEPLPFDAIVGSAPQFRTALAIAAKAARARVPVVIEGEGGTGKQVVAEAIHAASPRARRPMIRVDCAAIATNLIESELFGHERGAFPGAFERRTGRIAAADGSTLYLDGIGELPFDAQVRLLRVVQSGEVHAVGARHARPIDIRIIAASSKPLVDEVEAGRFREDLYYQLNVVHVAIPPLRERPGDIAALARHLMARIARQPGLRQLGITDDAIALLAGYGWPGNVRQLQNALFRAAVRCEGDALTRADFPQIATLADDPDTVAVPPRAADAGGVTLFASDGNLRALEEIEADVIRLAIGHYRGRMSEVARRLGIGRSTLYRKLGELGIDQGAA